LSGTDQKLLKGRGSNDSFIVEKKGLTERQPVIKLQPASDYREREMVKDEVGKEKKRKEVKKK